MAYATDIVDESLHWHEFDSVTWVIDGTGAFADERVRVVVGTSLPAHEWTMPLNRDPADRPSPG